MKLWLSFVSCSGFPEDALLISCGFQATHILPVVGGAVDHTHCKRLNVGGSHLVTYMQHLVQLQVPSLRQYIYHSRAEVSWKGKEREGGGGEEGVRGCKSTSQPPPSWMAKETCVFLLPTLTRS